MEKTVQQMEAAIFAYCDEVCPKFQDSHAIEGIVTLYREHSGIRVYNFDTNTMIFTNGKSNREGSIRYHYRLLGLAERDAVAAKNAELAESEIAFERQANILQSERAKVSQLQKESDQHKKAFGTAASHAKAQAKRIAELQSRNTALVAALEAAKYAMESGNGHLGCRKMDNGAGYFAENGTAYDDLCKAIRANTEKGGVQG